MEKKKITINYYNSGVKTLSGFGNLFFIIGGISIFAALIAYLIYTSTRGSYGEESTAIVAYTASRFFVQSIIPSLFFGAICKGLAPIARTAHYKRTLLEQEYEFTEKRQTNAPLLE